NIPSPSHHIWNRALAFGLTNKGHNVTYIGPDEDEVPKPQNYTHILLEGVYEDMNHNFDINEMSTYGPIELINEFENWCIHQCQLNSKSKGLRELLIYPPNFKFDLIVIDITAGTCLYPLIRRFNYPPTVGVTPFLLPVYVSYSLGNHLFPSFIPWYGFQYTTEMNFYERTLNFLVTYIQITLRYVSQYPQERKIAKKVFGGNIPPMEELERHISLVLANSDPLLDYAQPVPPNIILVGGLHARKSKEIPHDYQKLLDNAKNGVILFSLGTNIRSDKLDKETQAEILNAFSKISETVIWKFESKIENLPKNVIVRKWLPQNDILGHPNVKLFIGHGGALSTQETIFHGVPMVVVPFAFDQHINSRLIVKKRLGVQIDFRRITSDYFLKKIREVLDNPTYNENMKNISKIFKDRMETPLERAVFWTEYVLRHGGAEFLNTSARNLPFYKSFGVDVVTFLILIIYI
ncbi:UDP-glucuronosyltransferase 2B17-like, partial [Asbolus verrucosus]